MRYAQLVTGSAGSGKSTYCSAMVKHAAATNRTVEVVNLDPAAERFRYEPLTDIRQLINVQDTMEDEELHFGPNGGLVFCLEYLLEHSDWLKSELGDGEDDYILFDCPGQIELYTHLPVMRRLTKRLQDWGFNVCLVFLIDVNLMLDGAKFLSGTMAALSATANLELPHVNVLSKIDLLGQIDLKKLQGFLEPDPHRLLGDIETNTSSAFNARHKKLTEAIADLIENYSLVRFYPLNLKDSDSISDVLMTIDNAIQYGEDLDVRTKNFEEPDEND